MKKIILIVILSMLISSGAGASEIFGQISTNPSAPAGAANPPGDDPAPDQTPNPRPVSATQSGVGAVILPEQARQMIRLEIRPEENQATPPEPAVLGVKIYPDGSLLRGSDRKIYLIQGQMKKYIASLAELKKYQGRVIFKATAKELAGYEAREHLDGELIRQRGEIRVYIIVQGVKKHIVSLAELRANYFGLEIFNLSREAMAQY